jgi:hypothetical protein
MSAMMSRLLGTHVTLHHERQAFAVEPPASNQNVSGHPVTAGDQVRAKLSRMTNVTANVKR